MFNEILLLSENASPYLQNETMQKIINNLSFDLKKLIQPIGHKACWNNCAQILICVGYPRNEIVLTEMFEWLKDLNWPGADEIRNYLPLLPKEIFIQYYQQAVHEAQCTNDEDWLMFLYYYYKELNLSESDFSDNNIAMLLENYTVD